MIITHLFISQHYSCIRSHKHSLDIKVLFIAAFYNTVTNNTAQHNNNKDKQKSISPNVIIKGDLCSVNIRQYFPFWK